MGYETEDPGKNYQAMETRIKQLVENEMNTSNPDCKQPTDKGRFDESRF